MNSSEIFIKHKDWNGICYLDNNKFIITRKEYTDETGKYVIDKNKLIIKWDKWNEEIFIKNVFDNDNGLDYDTKIYKNKYILKSEFDLEYKEVFLYQKDCISKIIVNFNKLIYFYCLDYELHDTIEPCNISTQNIELEDSKLILFEYMNSYQHFKTEYIKINEYNYYLYDNNIYFELKIIENNKNMLFLYNSFLKTFYNFDDLMCNGNYEMVNNYIYMKYNNGIIKKYYANHYSNNSLNSNVNKNINVIKPNCIKKDDRILFSNISLCKNKIILTSIHYRDNVCLNQWSINNCDFIVMNENNQNINIIKKNIYDNNDNFEASIVIILELDTIPNNEVLLSIGYDNYIFKVKLKDLNIKDHNISAMTLFKDDYILLKQYLRYYKDLGVDLFFIYYNGNINDEILKYINELNNEKLYDIYIVLWDYIYWWNNEKLYHHAQTMAITDSLNILKNYGNYTLYNDLDEYVILSNIDYDFNCECNSNYEKNNINIKYNTFNDMIENNKETDIFIFKNRFCQMGHDLISYKDFCNTFNLNNIIKGNLWLKKREKNLIKLKSINVMGVHSYFEKFNNNNDNQNNKLIISNMHFEFYHIINFIEKNRPELLTEYID
jgi:hypothetical protein